MAFPILQKDFEKVKESEEAKWKSRPNPKIKELNN
jgi:hypothetical protein